MAEQGTTTRQTLRIRVAHAVRRLFTTATNQRDVFVAAMIAHAGDRYGTGGCRCGGCGYEDCSGEQCLGLNAAGIQNMPAPCMTSFVMAEWCQTSPRPAWMLAQFGPDPYTGSTTVGTGITQAQAAATIGAWAFHGNDLGKLPNARGTGHIKCNGKIVNGVPIAIEGYDTAEGVTFDHPFLPDAEVTYCALPPGMTGFQTVAPTAHRRSRTMLVITNHYNADGTVSRPTKPPIGQTSVVTIAADGSCLEALWDASIANDQPVPGTAVRRWTPGAVPLPPGVTIVDLAGTPAGSAHTGGVVLLSDGNTEPFRLS